MKKGLEPFQELLERSLSCIILLLHIPVSVSMLLMDCPVRVGWSALQPEWRPPQIQFPCDG